MKAIDDDKGKVKIQSKTHSSFAPNGVYIRVRMKRMRNKSMEH